MTTSEMLDESTALPTDDDVGRVAEWKLPSGTGVLRVYAQLLGVSTSFQPQHYDHAGAFAPRRDRCRACRWFEPRIFREVGGRRRYLVHRTGRSIVPGEVSLTSHEWAHGGYEVVEALTTRGRDANTGDKTPPYLTQPAARVLAQAASYDDDLGRAYVDRAVA